MQNSTSKNKKKLFTENIFAKQTQIKNNSPHTPPFNNTSNTFCGFCLFVVSQKIALGEDLLRTSRKQK